MPPLNVQYHGTVVIPIWVSPIRSSLVVSFFLSPQCFWYYHPYSVKYHIFLALYYLGQNIHLKGCSNVAIGSQRRRSGSMQRGEETPAWDIPIPEVTVSGQLPGTGIIRDLSPTLWDKNRQMSWDFMT